MPASPNDEEVKGKAGAPDAEIEIVGDDDDGFVEVKEDGTPVQDRAVTGDTDDGDEPDDDGDDDAGTDTDRAKLEQKRKKAAQRENAKLKRQMAAMEEELAAIRQHQTSVREVELERLRETVNERVSAAEQALETAYEDGDAKGIVAAQRTLHQAQSEADRWEREAPKGAKQPRPASAAAPNPLVDDFIDRHDWFDMKGRDFESKLVIQLSEEIAREGKPGNTKAHFVELEARMAKYLPDRAKPPAPKSKPRASASAPSSHRSTNGEGTSGNVPIPKATIAGFKEQLGIDWDDPDQAKRKEARAKITARVIESRKNKQGDTA